MGARKEARDAQHFREMFDAESKQRESSVTRTTLIENQADQIERLRLLVNDLQKKLTDLEQALEFESKEHQVTKERAKQAAQTACETNTSLVAAYSEAQKKLSFIKPFVKFEAMLLPCDDGGFTLVHPAVGGLGTFASLKEARVWAAQHDGFIPRALQYHAFHGEYYRVGFNLW